MDGATQRQTVPQAIELITAILDLADRLRARVDSPCEMHGISAARFAVIAAIDFHEGEGCSQTDLATQLQLSESNISALVEGLRKRGLLYRFRSKIDRRRSVLLLTDSGQKLAKSIAEAQESIAVSLVEKISDEPLAELFRLVCQMTEHLAVSEGNSATEHDKAPPAESASSSLRRAS